MSTSGSEGGQQKPTSPKADRALLADPYTYVRIPSGFAYTAFIVDVCTRKIVGWSTAASLHTEILPMQTLEQALQSSGVQASKTGLVHHSDRGSNYVSLTYTDALITAGVKASVGSVGDSYDNALAETVNGLYKAELIHSRRTWPSVTAVEIATLEWVHWWNTKRLHQAFGTGRRWKSRSLTLAP